MDNVEPLTAEELEDVKRGLRGIGNSALNAKALRKDLVCALATIDTLTEVKRSLIAERDIERAERDGMELWGKSVEGQRDILQAHIDGCMGTAKEVREITDEIEEERDAMRAVVEGAVGFMGVFHDLCFFAANHGYDKPHPDAVRFREAVEAYQSNHPALAERVKVEREVVEAVVAWRRANLNFFKKDKPGIGTTEWEEIHGAVATTYMAMWQAADRLIELRKENEGARCTSNETP